jgi:hypothetical protein
MFLKILWIQLLSLMDMKTKKKLKNNDDELLKANCSFCGPLFGLYEEKKTFN